MALLCNYCSAYAWDTFALPNLYPAQPAIQVAYTDSSKSADQSLLNTIREEISKQDIEISEINLKNNNIVIG